MLAKRNQRGDTIVEVMLSMAVVGVVIGATYATVNRALRSGRYAQEISQATQLAQGQLEIIKYMASNPSLYAGANDIFASGGTPFCVSDAPAKLAATSASCRVSNLYDMSVVFDATKNDLFTVTVKWERDSGDGPKDANVSMAYRVHKL